MNTRDWMIDHWPGLSGLVVATAASVSSIGLYLRGKSGRQAIADYELAKIRENIESEARHLLDLRAQQIADNAKQMQLLETKVEALTQLYGKAIVALQEANSENAQLRRQIERYELSDAQLRDQLREQNKTIEGLRKRVSELERRDSGDDAKGAADAGR
jgi:chromosome segregation ATPase